MVLNNSLDVLFDISKQWVYLPRTSDVAKAAISFLQNTFQIDAGLVSYERRPRANGDDYLRTARRWFTSWGFQTPQQELGRAIEASMDFGGELRSRQWFRPHDLPPAWQAISDHNDIKEIGIWTVCFEREPVGLFVLARKTQRQVDDSQVISRCMAHIAVVIELVITRRLAQEMSIRDPLTGIFNRRGLLTELDRLVRGNEPVTLAVIDLDCFKQFNDNNGQ